MDIFTSLKVSASALTAQRTRMNIISSNLANMETTKTQEGAPYRRKELVIRPVPVKERFNDILEQKLSKAVQEVQVVGYVNDPRDFISKYEPGHPDADQNGYVKYPNISVIEETTNLIISSRAYESNVTVIQTTKKMAQDTLEIGR